ncbi:cAMP-responsive element modulator isoform X1 [Amia ocellicauda]|uniref:cAMP-responsive element modulator isoform X1 n=2 Tax=Amia ocellicauda TaxID=2972642 RepID=UPI0034639E62
MHPDGRRLRFPRRSRRAGPLTRPGHLKWAAALSVSQSLPPSSVPHGPASGHSEKCVCRPGSQAAHSCYCPAGQALRANQCRCVQSGRCGRTCLSLATQPQFGAAHTGGGAVIRGVSVGPMTMETVVESKQDGSVDDSVADGEAIQMQNQSTHSPVSKLAQVSVTSSGVTGGSPAVTVVQLPGGQTVQVQGVIQAPQPSVIQSPQIQTVQVAAIAESDDAESTEGVTDTQKRREILSRRPSYRKILNELSSDTPAVPKIEEEKAEEEGSASSVAPISVPSIYQTSTGQYIAISQGGAIQIASPGGDGIQGLQTLTMTNSGTPQPGATIVQYTAQSSDGTQQFFVPGSQVVVQAATGDMPTYQIRTPTSSLPQGVVMAASPSSLHSPQQLAEEATRKRELRLMKNREAARECRRKKKEYVKCLENRVAVLENQNKTLIEELKALKDLYCHKTE